MLNKFLCWMWGHQEGKTIKIHMFWPFNGGTSYVRLVKKCKHCGEPYA